ncbi:hypothetical protein ABT158_33385 [Nonomuraea sp. NPDC001636]|uniref:hypothetical protein n=1 Tax=Nonomuraea sp. NPDC001636 TaxID=3154391 RepID=UPI003323096F
MKRILAWIGVNVDILVALAVAVVVSVLDVAGIATAEAVSNAQSLNLFMSATCCRPCSRSSRRSGWCGARSSTGCRRRRAR